MFRDVNVLRLPKTSSIVILPRRRVSYDIPHENGQNELPRSVVTASQKRSDNDGTYVFTQHKPSANLGKFRAAATVPSVQSEYTLFRCLLVLFVLRRAFLDYIRAAVWPCHVMSSRETAFLDGRTVSNLDAPVEDVLDHEYLPVPA